jgi:hypothetical protein
VQLVDPEFEAQLPAAQELQDDPAVPVDDCVAEYIPTGQEAHAVDPAAA